MLGEKERQRCRPLTPRQRQVAEALLQGKSNEEIATTLGIGRSAVRKHLTQIYRRTGTRDRLQFVVRVLRYGMHRW